MDRIAGIPVKQSQSELPLSFLSADCEIYELLFSQVQPLIILRYLLKLSRLSEEYESRHFKFLQTLFHIGGTLFPSDVTSTNSTKKVAGSISSIERNAYMLNAELFWLNSSDQ